MSLRLTAEELATYRHTAQKRWQTERQDVARRRLRAWSVARRAASLLKKEFGATRVVVFGSLVHKDCFTAWSDVDLAAWGIRPQDTFRAVAALLGLSDDVEINLVDVATCRPSLLATIEGEGIDL